MDQAFFGDVEIVKHDSPIPYYFQLSGYIEHKIKTKELLAGHLMPSEQEICQRLAISRTVVRQAMADLERRGNQQAERKAQHRILSQIQR